MLQFLHDEVGYNYRMTNVQASLGLAQLERLEGFIEHKIARYEQYRAALDGYRGLRILPFRDEDGSVRSNHWFYSLDLRGTGLRRDEVIAALQAQDIQTRPIWALIHEQADYPQNEAYALDKALAYRENIVNLPCSTNLSEADCARVIAAVQALADRASGRPEMVRRMESNPDPIYGGGYRKVAAYAQRYGLNGLLNTLRQGKPLR